jgi:hypothetical protein
MSENNRVHKQKHDTGESAGKKNGKIKHVADIKAPKWENTKHIINACTSVAHVIEKASGYQLNC